MSLDQIVEEIDKLTASEKVGLVDRILEGLGGIDPEIERSHLEAVAERRRNPGILIPVDEVLRDIRDSLKK